MDKSRNMNPVFPTQSSYVFLGSGGGTVAVDILGDAKDKQRDGWRKEPRVVRQRSQGIVG